MKYKIDLDEARQIEQLEIKIEWLQNANTNFVRRICDQTREIERPRAIIDTPSEEPEWVVDFKKLNRFAGVGYSLIDIEIAKKWHTAYRKAQNSNLLRKQEIERMREEMENYGDDYVCQMKSKDSRIQELEDALVEERARCIELGRAASTGRFKPVPPLQESKELARRQLQRDGKIGPDAIAAAHNKCSEMVCYNCGKKMEDIPGEKIKGDYLIGEIWLDPGQEESRWDPPIEASYYFECHECAPSWEITEERKAAIKELSELLTAIGCPSCHYYIQKNYGEDITVLRAMLTEADHDKP